MSRASHRRKRRTEMYRPADPARAVARLERRNVRIAQRRAATKRMRYDFRLVVWVWDTVESAGVSSALSPHDLVTDPAANPHNAQARPYVWPLQLVAPAGCATPDLGQFAVQHVRTQGWSADLERWYDAQYGRNAVECWHVELPKSRLLFTEDGVMFLVVSIALRMYGCVVISGSSLGAGLAGLQAQPGYADDRIMTTADYLRLEQWLATQPLT